VQSEHDGMAAGRGQRALDGATRHHDTRRVLAGVVVFLRLVAVPPVVVAIASGVKMGAYTAPWLAVCVYLLLIAWGVAFVLIVLRRGAVPGWVIVTEVVVIALCVLLLRWAVHPSFFELVDGSDLEWPTDVAIVVVAMNCRIRQVVAAVCVLAGAHIVAELPAMTIYSDNIGATITDVLSLAGAALVSALISHRLLNADDQADKANREVAELQAQAAEARARSQERVRYLREQTRCRS
jgi:hypothetical protein